MRKLAEPKAPLAQVITDIQESVNERAQIELNQIIERKLVEFRSISSAKSAGAKRESDMAMRIDDLTAQVRVLEHCRREGGEVQQENAIVKQQLDMLKQQLQDGFKINRELQADCQKMKDEYRVLGLVKAREQKTEAAFSFLNSEFIS